MFFREHSQSRKVCGIVKRSLNKVCDFAGNPVQLECSRTSKYAALLHFAGSCSKTFCDRIVTNDKKADQAHTHSTFTQIEYSLRILALSTSQLPIYSR
ncbi:MAG: hypothetical protein LBF72_03760 [Holosporales bacterium]|nr:hypothetical protein [Holosporales bacterium]